MDDLIKQINHENPNIDTILKQIKENEKILATNKIHFCSIFPFEESILILSSDNFSNTSKAYLLYFIGYFALSESFFPIDLFERDDVISLLFSFLNANSMIRNQCVHAFQNIVPKSHKYIKYLLENDIFSFVVETKPYFRIIDIITQMFEHYMKNQSFITDSPFTEENIELLIHIFEIYFNTKKPKEMSYALKYFRSFLLFFDSKFHYNEESSNPLLSYLCTNIPLKELLLSSSKEVVEQSGLLLELLPKLSIEYVQLLINSFLHHGLSLETVFHIFLQNIDEWGGYDKDIILEFIRSSIPNSSFHIAKLGSQIYLKLCNANEEWDTEIMSTIARFVSEPDLTFQIFQLFIELNETIPSQESKLTEEDISDFHEIIQELMPVAEETLCSNDQKIATISLEFIKTFEQT